MIVTEFEPTKPPLRYLAHPDVPPEEVDRLLDMMEGKVPDHSSLPVARVSNVSNPCPSRKTRVENPRYRGLNRVLVVGASGERRSLNRSSLESPSRLAAEEERRSVGEERFPASVHPTAEKS